ncbi:MAG: hypothetical protein DMD34_15940 [Gemmatimonadetes bacterium]|nr:MAG: hypothetical protein DMD34_15940 [Gemmatimonadota bacterium]
MRLLLLLPTVTYRTVAFVEAARRLGVELTVASERPSTFEHANPAGLVTLDFTDPTRAAAQARAFARELPVHGVVGVDDDTAVIAAVVAEELGLRGNSVAAAAAARDKYQQRVLLAKAGVAVPRVECYPIASDSQELARHAPYPCVLKPLRLSASRGVIRADDAREFVAAFRRLKAMLEEPEVASCGEWARHLLVEEFIPGREVAVEGLVTEGRLRVLAIFDKPDPLDGPFFEETIYVTPSRLTPAAHQEITACTQATVTALGLRDGPIHAEIRYNDEGGWLIELAARPIGGRCSGALRFGAGVSLEEIVIRHALGMELPSLEREGQASGVMMIPVPRGGVLRHVRGVEEARAVPLVDAVEITAHPGQTLVPWPEAALRAAHGRLEFVIG